MRDQAAQLEGIAKRVIPVSVCLWVRLVGSLVLAFAVSPSCALCLRAFINQHLKVKSRLAGTGSQSQVRLAARFAVVVAVAGWRLNSITWQQCTSSYIYSAAAPNVVVGARLCATRKRPAKGRRRVRLQTKRHETKRTAPLVVASREQRF